MLTATNASPHTLGRESSEHLAYLLRTDSNRLEMLLNPDEPHHEDDAERRRIQRLDLESRSELQREVLIRIQEIRAELRRRGAE